MAAGDEINTWHCVMLHAAGSSPRALAALTGRLEASGVRVVAPQLPMRVQPADQARGTPFAPQVAIARHALEQSGLRRRLVFGHSFGALLALLALLDGAEVDLAILYEPIVLAALADGDAADRAARSWDKALIDQLSERVTAGDPEPGLSRFIEAYNEVQWRELPERARAAMLAEADHIRDVAAAVHHLPLSMPALGALTTRIVVLSGDRTLEVARRMSAAVAGKLAQSSHVIVRDGGHMAPVRLPEIVAELVLRQMRRDDVDRTE